MDTYGLVGHPLKHSFSRVFFTEKFEKERIDGVYLNFDIPDISLFPTIVESHPTLKGLNVTIPYKEKIIPYLDELDSQAKEIGAVNVIKLKKEEEKIRLIGYNTDVIGFQNSIAPLLNKNLHHKALILGTGGASKAVSKGLQNLGVNFTYVSRTPQMGQFSYRDIDKDILNEYTIIINTSPLGTYPDINNTPNIPYNLLTPEHLLFDLVYNPAETLFLKQGKERGATVKNGEEMLILQAIAAWDIWNK